MQRRQQRTSEPQVRRAARWVQLGRWAALAVLAPACLAPGGLRAQDTVRVVPGVSATAGNSPRAISDSSRAARALPFGVGELVTYQVKFGPLRVGTATMEVVGVETVRDRAAWHLAFAVRGRALFYTVDDLHESWIDTTSLASLRFVQRIHEGRRRRHRRFEIFPERAVYTDGGETEHPSVSDPLDDGSFLYFVRTLPLAVGETHEFHRYFRPDRNPVTIRVLRRERVTVPAGTFDAIVVQPVIKTRGIFAEGGEAEVWLSDDAARIVVRLKATMSIGTLSLELKEYRKAGAEKLASQK